MGAQYNNVDIVRKFSEYLNEGDFNAADEYLTDDYTHHNYKDTYHGKEAFRETMMELRTYFPDMEVRIEESVEDGDTVVNRLTWYGTHEGPFAGLPATHKRIEISGLALFHMKDGKIDEQWVEFNVADGISQIGAVPKMPEDC